MHKIAVLILTTLIFSSVSVSIHEASAQSYFIKKNQQQSEEAAQKKKSFWDKLFNKNNNPAGVKIEKRDNAPTVKTQTNRKSVFVQEKAKPSQKQTNTKKTGELPKQELTRKISSAIKAEITDSFGPCTQKDRELITLSKIGTQEYERQVNEFIEKGEKSGRYTEIEGMTPEKLEAIYERTGELPEQYQRLIKEQPVEALSTLETVMKNAKIEDVAQARMRCFDMK